MSRTMVAIGVALAGASLASAQDVSPPRGGFLRRTPAVVAREMSTDRPDRTESPYTVPMGWVQFEFDAAAYSRDRVGSETTREWSVMALNAKIGLTTFADLQLTAVSYRTARTRTGIGPVTTDDGVGSYGARLKVNLLGNDRGPVAVGVMPFVERSPNGRGGRALTTGFILPVTFDLGRDWSLGTMGEIDLGRDDDGFRTVALVHSVTVARPLAGPVGGYLEWFGATGHRVAFEGTVDGGVTIGLGPNMQLDAGVNLGVTRAAAGVNPFLGLATRF